MVKANGKTERMKVYIFFKFSSLASIFAGGLSCGLYTTNSPATTKYICQQAPLDFIVLQDIQMMEEMLKNEPDIDKVEIFLEQREVAFLSPCNICENLNFSREIMFHISTLLPHEENDPQKVSKLFKVLLKIIG